MANLLNYYLMFCLPQTSPSFHTSSFFVQQFLLLLKTNKFAQFHPTHAEKVGYCLFNRTLSSDAQINVVWWHFQIPLSTGSHPRCRPPRRSTGTLWRSPWGRRRWWEVWFQNQNRKLWSRNFHSFIGDRPSWNWWCSGQEAQWQGFWQGIYYKARIGPLVCCVYVWMWSGGMDSGVFSDLVMFDISGVCCARAVLAVEEEQRPLRWVDQGSKNDWSILCKCSFIP